MAHNVETQLGHIVGRLRERGQWAVSTAVAAAQNDDIACTLVLQINGSKRIPEAYLIGGSWQPQVPDAF